MRILSSILLTIQSRSKIYTQQSLFSFSKLVNLTEQLRLCIWPLFLHFILAKLHILLMASIHFVYGDNRETEELRMRRKKGKKKTVHPW